MAAKANKILLHDSQSKEIILDQPSIIQIGVTQQNIQSMTKSGQNLIIILKNGEQIVLDNFFTPESATSHSLVFPEPDGSFVLANFNTAGKFVNYSGLQKLEPLLYEGAESVPVAQVQAYQSTAATASESDFSFSNLLSSSAVKAGLGIATVAGLSLALVDGGGGSNSSKDPIDLVAPAKPTAILSEDGKTISGTGEAGSIVTVIDKSGKVVASVTVDKDGHYSVQLPEALENNNVLYLNAKDKAGNASGYVFVTGTKDTIAPDEPQAQLNEFGNIVTGKSEPNATINVYDPQGNLIGTAKASSDGTFNVPISPALTAGQVGKVESVDASGNKSDKHSIELGKDTIAPDQAKFEVSIDGTTVNGIAEANAKVIIQDSKGIVIGTGTADANGKFTVTVSPVLDKTTAGKIIVEDGAGNQSKPVDIKAGQDTLAPDQPVASLNAEGTIITGTAEANSTISVYDSANKLLGTATVDANGHYSVTLSTALTEKKSATIYAKDAAGNQSTATTVTGTKDITAPNAPKITDVQDDVGSTTGSVAAGGSTDDKRPVISGTTDKAEAGGTLIIFDNGKALGSVIVGIDGKWSFSLESDLSLGSHNITAVLIDKSGNTSLASDARTFTVVEADVTTTNSVNDASLFHDSLGLVTETNTDSSVSTNSVTTKITTDSVIEPNSIAVVLNDTNYDVNTASLSTATLYRNESTVDVSDLLTSNIIEHSVQNTIEQVIDRATVQTTLDVNAEKAILTKTSNSTFQDLEIPVVKSDSLADLLNPQMIIF